MGERGVVRRVGSAVTLTVGAALGIWMVTSGLLLLSLPRLERFRLWVLAKAEEQDRQNKLARRRQ